jgi:tRNA threonylcarbamoyl adenosine modification protein YeaZ
MLLAFDTSSAACTAALFDGSGICVAHIDERIGRGHAERLMPMIAMLLEGRRADQIMVGVGPGSFTGIRVGIAAAHGLAIGWDAGLVGMSSLALLARSTEHQGEVAVAVTGGHGELFVQQFDEDGAPASRICNLAPDQAAAAISAEVVIGSGAHQLVDARGWGTPKEAWPSAAHSLSIPSALRSLPAKPVYARAPDARAKEAA